jgi:hypothetical protein
MAGHLEEEVLPSRTLRVLVVVNERDVHTIQHAPDLAIVARLVVSVSGVYARAREQQHTEVLTITANVPFESSEDVL